MMHDAKYRFEHYIHIHFRSFTSQSAGISCLFAVHNVSVLFFVAVVWYVFAVGADNSVNCKLYIKLSP